MSSSSLCVVLIDCVYETLMTNKTKQKNWPVIKNENINRKIDLFHATLNKKFLISVVVVVVVVTEVCLAEFSGTAKVSHKTSNVTSELAASSSSLEPTAAAASR